MNSKENKRSRGRRSLYTQSKAGSNATSSNTSASISQLLTLAKDTIMNCEVPTDFTFSAQEDAEKITELMDTPLDFDIPAHAISKGPNPYLDRCWCCTTLRTVEQDGDEGTEFLDWPLDGNTLVTGQSDSQSFSSIKLEIWTCPKCRNKVAGNFQSYLEASLPDATCEDTILSDQVPSLDSWSCTQCDEGSGCRANHTHESKEMRKKWNELKTIVSDLHTCTEEPALSQEQGNRLKFLIERLCQRDPHQLFLGLESQVREMVNEIKGSLLQRLKENGVNNPTSALDFTSALLRHYDHITKKAHLLAQYLGGLTDHLKQFQVTWELLNKHLFHSIAHNDPAISSVGPTILEQLRQGSLQYEKSREDPFCSVRKRLLKFQEEMSVVVVVWRDCQQLIENYCQEEFTNTQKQVSHRAKSFITQQRQLLKNHLMKDSFMDEETMKSLVSGHKSSTEKVLCHRCKRERCTCDECTITHMITCGIINTEKGTTLPPPPSSFNFALDHTHNLMDITPPSMSSTTSSSGSVSPTNVEDKISAYYGCEKSLTNAIVSCEGKDKGLKGLTLDDIIDNIDGNAGDDEAEDDLEETDGVDQHDINDEPHAMQLPMWDTLGAHQLLQNHNSNEHVTLSTHGTVPHSCSHCLQQFQPRIDSHLSKQLDAEIANSGFSSSNMNDYVTNTLVGSSDGDSENQGSSDGSVLNPNICAACQCHACLKQSGHVISTSLPLQIPVSPPPAELNLYPHIHGPPQGYMFGFPSPLLSSAKKLDFDDPASIHDHLYHAYSDWDNPRPGSLAAQHQHQPCHRLSGLTSDLLPPVPVADAMPTFSFEALSLTTQTLTNTSSAFKTISGKSGGNASTANGCGTEGSSVDPTTKPLDFSSFLRIPQACLNSTSSSLPLFTSSVPSVMPSSVVSNLPVTTSVTASKVVNGSSHGPPSSRPVPVGGNTAAISKWEKTHSLQCKKFPASGRNKFPLLNQQGEQVNPFSTTNLQPSASFSIPQNAASSKNISNSHQRSSRSSLPCPHPSPSPPKACDAQASAIQSPTSNHSSTAAVSSVSTSISHSTPPIPTSCTNTNLTSAIVNNIGVGTTAPCVDVECKVHHEENCDSVDDSCSERSSSTSSNRKEGKYCDCCCCEFFGHNNPQGAKTSPNYFEMKDRLRKKLKKKNETKHKSAPDHDPPQLEGKKEEQTKVLTEKRGLDELLNFINGTDDGNRSKTTTKAAKRARQKQRKLEEKARLENGPQKLDGNHRQPELTKSLTNLLIKSPSVSESNSLDQYQGKVSTEQEKIKELHKKLALLKEEMKHETTRSSMVIESTRPTISLSPVTKNGNSIEKVLDIIFKHNQQSQHGPCNGKTTQSFSPVISNKDTSNQADKGSAKSMETKKCMSVTKEQASPQIIKQVGKQQQHPFPQAPKTSRSQKVEVVTNSPNHIKSAAQNISGEKKAMISSASNCLSSSNTTSADSVPNGVSASKGHTVTTNSSVSKGVFSSASTASVSTPSAVSSNKVTVIDNFPCARSGKSSSESPSSRAKTSADQTKPAGAKSKNKKKKNKSENGDVHNPEEVFMPKSQSELDGSVDDFERELEEFKRFCFENSEPKEKRKLAVNVNLKDIFKKKSTFA